MAHTVSRVVSCPMTWGPGTSPTCVNVPLAMLATSSCPFLEDASYAGPGVFAQTPPGRQRAAIMLRFAESTPSNF